jgi:hypothetical protein
MKIGMRIGGRTGIGETSNVERRTNEALSLFPVAVEAEQGGKAGEAGAERQQYSV